MLALTKVKKNIEFNQQFHSVLEVLKSIAVSQFQALERKLHIFEPLDGLLSNFFSFLDMTKVHHPFVEGQKRACAVIAVTSDQGLLGGLNARVLSKAIEVVQTVGGQLIVIGEQGKTFARHNKVSFVAFPGVRDDARYQQAIGLRDYLFEKIYDGKFDSIRTVYPKAFSLANQRVEHEILLPLGAERPSSETLMDLSQVIFESSVEDVLAYLACLRVGQRLNDIFGMSRLAELGARYMHLEESTQKIQEMNKKLKLQYFRLRHEVIDQSMRELFSARSLYA